MVTEGEVETIAKLADISIQKEELADFTHQFNKILEYFDILDTVEAEEPGTADLYNILREDELTPSLSQEEAIGNSPEKEDSFIKAPRVM